MATVTLLAFIGCPLGFDRSSARSTPPRDVVHPPITHEPWIYCSTEGRECCELILGERAFSVQLRPLVMLTDCVREPDECFFAHVVYTKMSTWFFDYPLGYRR